ncbi:hypothetical protein M3185_16050 [Kocuria rosea]|jgi:hypothetical protein|nr:hypothetical protein [Kocuria rosea]MCM3689491.1 hypothetical protein [Kocuria rosea]
MNKFQALDLLNPASNGGNRPGTASLCDPFRLIGMECRQVILLHDMLKVVFSKYSVGIERGTQSTGHSWLLMHAGHQKPQSYRVPLLDDLPHGSRVRRQEDRDIESRIIQQGVLAALKLPA